MYLAEFVWQQEHDSSFFKNTVTPEGSSATTPGFLSDHLKIFKSTFKKCENDGYLPTW